MDTFGTACDTDNEAGLCFEGCLICSIFPLRVMRQHRFATSTQCSLTQRLIFFPGTEEFSVLPVFPGSSGNVLVSDSMKSWWIKTTNDAVSIVSSPWKFGECLHCILQWDARWTMNLMVIRSSIGRHDTAKKKWGSVGGWLVVEKKAWNIWAVTSNWPLLIVCSSFFF